jgi:hypothetical protein
MVEDDGAFEAVDWYRGMGYYCELAEADTTSFRLYVYSRRGLTDLQIAILLGVAVVSGLICVCSLYIYKNRFVKLFHG